MQRYTQCTPLQRQGALLFRNIAARCPDLRPILLDAGAEAALRAAGRYQDVVDEAYAARRDLGCEVQRVAVASDGQVPSPIWLSLRLHFSLHLSLSLCFSLFLSVSLSFSLCPFSARSLSPLTFTLSPLSSPCRISLLVARQYQSIDICGLW